MKSSHVLTTLGACLAAALAAAQFKSASLAAGGDQAREAIVYCVLAGLAPLATLFVPAPGSGS